MQDSSSASLEDVNESVNTEKPKTRWGRIFAFFGPAYMISVGYMDPGNWATDLAGGSQFGYTLLWVLVMSNLMAFLLQSLAARLGIVARRDLAQASRAFYPKSINFSLYLLAEVAIAACDLAEVLGMAIGLQLLTDLPLMIGVIITVADTFLLLLLQRLGMRAIEIFILILIATIGLCFFAQVFMAQPNMGNLVKGFVPSIPNLSALYIAIGIIGATVMPHNLYLHSALVQTRKITRSEKGIRKAIKFNLIDTGIALNLAFLVNASILILGAAVFHANGMFEVSELQDAHLLLKPYLGVLAPTLFAIALIASGQSSTITGTIAGQVVMEGYLHIRLPIWLRRFITRMLAVVPAMLVIGIAGEGATGDLLIFSQVILSFQLGFAVVPLIQINSDASIMKQFVIPGWQKIAAWLIALIVIGFNIVLLTEIVGSFYQTDVHWVFKTIISIVILLLAGLLAFIIAYPTLKKFSGRKDVSIHGARLDLNMAKVQPLKAIGVTLDFTSFDNKAIDYALMLGGKEAHYHLIHIVETPNALFAGVETSDLETKQDQDYLNDYVQQLIEAGYSASAHLGYGRRAKSIAKLAIVEKMDALVMSSHGHYGIKDLFRGTTIDSVRHRISIPLFAIK